MTLAQFAIARVAAGLVERKDGLTAGEARLLDTLAPAVARYEREAAPADSSDCPPAKRANGR